MMYLEYQHFPTSKEIMSLGRWFSNGAILTFVVIWQCLKTVLVVTTGEEMRIASRE